MRRLLVLRPEPGASATLARANELGLEAFAVPLFEIERLSWQVPDLSRFDGLLLTSGNGAGAAREIAMLRPLPVYAVGEATARSARNCGLTIAAVGTTGIDGLLRSMPRDLKLLHVCGEDRRQVERAAQDITALAVYRARAVAAPDLRAAAGSVALVHSPRAGRRFAELIHDRRSIAIAAISTPAAQAAGAGWEALEAAPQPSDEALLALAARLCNKPHLDE